jgi:CoA:oxalate CoA-transferase
MNLDIDHPGHDIIRSLGSPIKLSGTPCRMRRSAPGFGEHSDEILAELGYASSDREAWCQGGVI